VHVTTGYRSRRRWTPGEKREMVQEAALPGNTLSSIARKYSISASLLFTWRRLMEQGGLLAMGSGEEVAPLSEVKALKTRIRELERLLGKKTMEAEILKEALELTQEKKRLLRDDSSRREASP
jgi:transposase